jgi:hypothetical protein
LVRICSRCSVCRLSISSSMSLTSFLLLSVCYRSSRSTTRCVRNCAALLCLGNMGSGGRTYVFDESFQFPCF